jgi:hypothetical protein
MFDIYSGKLVKEWKKPILILEVSDIAKLPIYFKKEIFQQTIKSTTQLMIFKIEGRVIKSFKMTK